MWAWNSSKELYEKIEALFIWVTRATSPCIFSPPQFVICLGFCLLFITIPLQMYDVVITYIAIVSYLAFFFSSYFFLSPSHGKCNIWGLHGLGFSYNDGYYWLAFLVWFSKAVLDKPTSHCSFFSFLCNKISYFFRFNIYYF